MNSMKNRKERWGKAKMSWYVRAWQQKKKLIQIEHKLSTIVKLVYHMGNSTFFWQQKKKTM